MPTYTSFPFPFPSVFGADPVDPGEPGPVLPTPPGWELGVIPRAESHRVVPVRQAISIETFTGVKVFDYLPEEQTSLTWSREMRQTSQCRTSIPIDSHVQSLELQPFLHWMSVFDADAYGSDVRPLWRGPIYTARMNRVRLNIRAVDPSAYMEKTRVPFSRKWESTDPSVIANELWQEMLQIHGLEVDTIVLPDPDGTPFDFDVTADDGYVTDVFDELSRLGLRWTVVSGVPILGPAPKNSILSLSDSDFMGDGPELVRDGSRSANDIMVRVADNEVKRRTAMGGLNLQAVFDVDNLSGITNAEHAVLEALRHYGRIHDSVILPPSVQLRPDAPVSIEQLIPSTRYDIDAYGMQTDHELDSLEVALSSDNVVLTVTMEEVKDPPELEEIGQQALAAGAVE